ncbi:MAG: hypothetical protein HY996_12510 [Micrococcales bacterium]|nr:hypothetical protein [Micrococcales bacterium]
MFRLASSTALVAAVLLASPGAFAQRANLYLSQAQIPARLSEEGLRNFMRSHHARQINEENDHQTWKFKVGTFFRSPPGDLEAHLLFYDVERGSRIFVTEMTVFLSSRDETAFLQNVTLSRPQFKPRNRYIVVLTVRRNEFTSANFELVGRPVERTGLVEFSDAETQDPNVATADQQRAAEEAQRVAIAREQARQREYEEAMREANASGGGGGEGGEGGEGEAEGGEEEVGDPPETGSGQSSGGGCASCSAAPRDRASGSLPVLVVFALGLAVAIRRQRRG